MGTMGGWVVLPGIVAARTQVSFCMMGLFDLILYVHSTIFQLCGTGLPGLNQY